MRDVLVIGGGLAGLVAARAAAERGAQVLLLAPELGGRARTTEEKGFRFNLGPHALFAGGTGLAALRRWGIRPKGSLPPLRGASWIGPEGPLPWSTLVRALPSLWALARAGGDPRPFQAWLDARPAAVAPFLAGVGRLVSYANAPELVPTSLIARQWRAAAWGGVRYLHHGWSQLVDALVRGLPSGVRRESGAARALAPERGGWRVDARDSSRRFDRVVLAVPYDRAVALCPALAQPQAITFTATCLDLGLAQLPRPGANFALGLVEPTYLSVHGAPGLAPPGGALVHALWYHAKGDGQDRIPALEQALDEVQPGWRERTVAQKVRRQIPVGTWLPARPAAPPGIHLAGEWVGPGWLADAAISSGLAAGRAAAEEGP